MDASPSDSESIFHGPIDGASGARRVLRRAALLALTGAAHLVAILAVAVADLMMVEQMNPPRAVTTPALIFRPTMPGGRYVPRPPADDGRRPRTTPTVVTRVLYPPAPRPTVIPLPPSDLPENAPADATWDAESTGDGSDGAGGPGNGGPGLGTGGPGGPGSGDGTIAGEGADEAVYPEGHPDIMPPIQIATRAYPHYPEMARKARVQGTVILLVVIDKEGRVGEIEVLRAPDPRFGFELAAIEAVKQWRYRPALLGGRPVAVQASVTIEFTINR